MDHPWPVDYLDHDFIVPLHPIVGGKLACVVPLTFGRARINVGPDRIFIEDGF